MRAQELQGKRAGILQFRPVSGIYGVATGLISAHLLDPVDR